MSWDRKAGGRPGGYFYVTVRTPDKPHPVKRYVGKGSAAYQMAAFLELKRRTRERHRRELAAERTRTAAADELTAELSAVASAYLKSWMLICGYHNHKGQWRVRRGGSNEAPA